MSYQRGAIAAWDPSAAAAWTKDLDPIADRLEMGNQRIRHRVVGMGENGTWSGSAHDAACAQMTAIADQAVSTAECIRHVRTVVGTGLADVDTTRLRLLRLAELAELDGVSVSDTWTLTPIAATAEDAALKLAEWTPAISTGIADLAAADAAAAASVDAAAAALTGSDNGMHGFLPLALIGLGVAVEAATAAFIAAGVVTGAAVIALLLDKFGSIASVDEILSKVPDVFRSDDGPGQWEPKNHHMSERAADYQEQVTGSPPGTEYVVDGVAFDGFAEGTLLDAKGPGYENFLDENGEWKPFFEGQEELVNQAQRQLDAAGDTPVEWRVAEERAAEAIDRLLDGAGLGDIEVVHVP